MAGYFDPYRQHNRHLDPSYRQSNASSMDVELLPTVGPGDLDHFPISPFPASWSTVDVDDDGRPKPVVRGGLGDILAPTFLGWPREARALDRTHWSNCSRIISDILYLLAPLLFLILGVKAVMLDGQPVSRKGEVIRQICWLSPTVFPIVFTAVAWRLLKVVALYMAEKGACLGTLEQLHGSRTLFGTLETHFRLRRLSFLAAGLLLLWVLSPLGGQASLRVLRVSDRSSPRSQNLRYVSTNQTSTLSDPNGINSYKYSINSLYNAALLPPGSDTSSSMDIWGNIKIPVFELAGPSPENSEDWLPLDKSNTSYSSLVGVPITGLPRRGHITLSIESSYFMFTCPVRTKVAMDDNLKAKLGPIHGGDNFGNIWGERKAGFILDTTTSFDRMNGPPQRGDSISPRKVVFGSLGPSNLVTIANCTIQRSSVESSITCVDRDCNVSRVRRSRLDGRAGGVTPFEDQNLCHNLFTSFAEAAGSVPKLSSTATEQYMYDPSSSNSAFFSNSLVDLSTLRQDLFERRLSLLFNTYWQASLAPWFIPGGSAQNLSSYQSTPSLLTNTLTAIATISEDNYHCKRAWLATLLLSSLILLFCGITASVLSYRTLAPDILGHISSLTRDNPYTPLPAGGCALDGGARTRLLRDLRVRIEDVKWREGVGHVAFSSIRGPADNVGMLRRGRLYTGVGMDGY